MSKTVITPSSQGLPQHTQKYDLIPKNYLLISIKAIYLINLCTPSTGLISSKYRYWTSFIIKISRCIWDGSHGNSTVMGLNDLIASQRHFLLQWEQYFFQPRRTTLRNKTNLENVIVAFFSKTPFHYLSSWQFHALVKC